MYQTTLETIKRMLRKDSVKKIINIFEKNDLILSIEEVYNLPNNLAGRLARIKTPIGFVFELYNLTSEYFNINDEIRDAIENITDPIDIDNIVKIILIIKDINIKTQLITKIINDKELITYLVRNIEFLNRKDILNVVEIITEVKNPETHLVICKTIEYNPKLREIKLLSLQNNRLFLNLIYKMIVNGIGKLDDNSFEIIKECTIKEDFDKFDIIYIILTNPILRKNSNIFIQSLSKISDLKLLNRTLQFYYKNTQEELEIREHEIANSFIDTIIKNGLVIDEEGKLAKEEPKKTKVIQKKD